MRSFQPVVIHSFSHTMHITVLHSWGATSHAKPSYGCFPNNGHEHSHLRKLCAVTAVTQHSCDCERQYSWNSKAYCLKVTQNVPVATQRASPLGCAAADPLFLTSLAPLRLPCKAKNLETQGMKRSSTNLLTPITFGRSPARPSPSLFGMYLRSDWSLGLAEDSRRRPRREPAH